ncbi:MAG TPA: hypothetical protein VFN23_07095 [Ktedonobacteraceae bacterium]|nr:hypothetical protein [Ktedonobacteraceae bacterium]
MSKVPEPRNVPGAEFSREEKIALLICGLLLVGALVDYVLFHQRFRDLAVVILVGIASLYLQMKARMAQRRRR